MASVLNRTTKQYLQSVNTPDYPTAQWIINPDVPSGWPTKYWLISGDTVTLMDQAARDAVDAAEAAAQAAAEKATAKGTIDTERLLIAAFTVTVDQINTLRAQHALAPATFADFKAAVKTEIDNG